jgi:hypothetical protein
MEQLFHDIKAFQEVEQKTLRYKTMNLIVEQFSVERLHGLKVNKHPFIYHGEDIDKIIYF